MLRWTFAALLGLAAMPSQAAVRFDFAEGFFNAEAEGSDTFALGLGTGGYGFDVSDYGGCEGSDGTGERCGAYENSSFSVTLTDNSLVYTAGLSQDQAQVGPSLSTDFSVYATFRADRQMRLRPTELRAFTVPLCQGTCTRSFGSNFWQQQQGDGTWLAIVEAGTSASTSEAVQRVNHSFSVTLAEVPEPQAWTLLIAGFGLVGAAQRWRRARLLA